MKRSQLVGIALVLFAMCFVLFPSFLGAYLSGLTLGWGGSILIAQDVLRFVRWLDREESAL